MNPLLAIALTALASSVATLALAYLVFRWKIEPRLRETIDAEVERAAARLGQELDRAGTRFGEEVETRVKRGIVDGVANLPSSEVVRDTTRSLARAGAELIGGGLEGLLRGPPRRRE